MTEPDDLFEFGDLDNTDELEIDLDELFGDLEMLSIDIDTIGTGAAEAPAPAPVQAAAPAAAAPAPAPAPAPVEVVAEQPDVTVVAETQIVPELTTTAEPDPVVSEFATNEIVEPLIVPVEGVGTISSDRESADSRPSKAQWPVTNLEQDPLFWWQVNLHRLGLAGMTKTLFAHSQWVAFDGQTLSLVVSTNYRKIMNDNHQGHLLQVIEQCLPGCVALNYEFGVAEKTPQLWLEQLVQMSKDKAYQYLLEDSFIVQMMSEYQAQLQQESAVTNHNPIPTGQ